ncbi:MAG: hypothetical protein JW900_14400 [Anaerolineae bacterium]|nr:hypothetical protein [Anaerolineae bacterium]
MDKALAAALAISAVGLAMLFAALLLLCGLMYLVTALFRERARPTPPPAARTSAAGQAAAVAVALARAEIEHQAAPPAPADRPSSWQQYHRQRMLNRTGPRGER